MAKITYEDKEFLNKNENIADKNKVNDTDLNEIKQVVNTNDDNIGDLSNLNTTDKSSLVSAINEVNDKGVKLLFNGNITTNGTDIKLSESINNFDLICIVSRNEAGSQSLIRLNTTIIPLALYKAGGTNYNIPASAASSIILNIDNDTTLNCQDGLTQYFAIMQVYGIKL